MDKPFKTVAEQIAILESRGMSVGGDAPGILDREGYYSVINGYKDLFIDRRASSGAGEDRFREGTTFDDVYKLFSFDRDLRLTMFRFFTIAEATLKTACAYCFTEAHQGEREPYMNASNYRKDEKHPEFVGDLISDFSCALGRNPKKKPKRKDYMIHYRENHDEVPLWVIMRYLTLGQAFKFYDFQTDSMKSAIAKKFSEIYAYTHDVPIRISPRKLRLVYDHIKDFRNICAHDERLYCARVSQAKDTSIATVISDLELVLPKSESARMVESVMTKILTLSNGSSMVPLGTLMGAMGIDDLRKTFEVRE